ncbi:MAG: glycoside hydrolase family 2 protein, partial [Halanaerobiales bacterium]
MRHISLNGQWMLNRKGSSEEIRAKVPGCVHMDLLEAGIIPDPFYRDNEKELMWIGETDWEYRRQFFVEKEILDYERIILRCHGLDTMATIIVNGRQVG